MTGTAHTTLDRVRSRDGTEIAHRSGGDGPPLLLVHGTTADHTRWRPVLPYLQQRATVHVMDRRGRGSSGDGPAYDLAREYEDVAAVVDAVAEASGARVDVLGHSYGGICAFGAATMTSNIARLVLYEGWPAHGSDDPSVPPLDVVERLEALLAAGQREVVLETFLREVVRMPDTEFEVYRTLPPWPARVAAAPTIPREIRAASQTWFDPAAAAKVTVPVLLLVGGDTPKALTRAPETVVAALPDARIAVLDGQQHIAIDLVPELFCQEVIAFLRSR